MRQTDTTRQPSRQVFSGPLLFLFFALSFLPLLSGCGLGMLNPFNDDSVWHSAHGIVESALLEGKAVVLVDSEGYAVWQKVGEPKTTFHTGSRDKKTFGGYRVIPVKPGEYTLIGGYDRLDDSSLDLKAATGEYISSRLGRVDLSNEDVKETYEYQSYELPTYGWVTDSGGNTRWEETRPGGYVTRTDTRVIGHYVAGRIVTPAAGAAGRPLWAGFRVAPGEVVLLQSVGFYALRPDYTQCRSTSIWGGAWSCPIKSVKFALGTGPDLEACRAAARKAGFVPALEGRIAARTLTPGEVFDGPRHSVESPSSWGASYVFESAPHSTEKNKAMPDASR